MKPFVKGQKNDYNDAEAIAEAALRPNLRTVREKSQEQLDLQACHRVRSRLVSRRTATINQIRAFLIEQGIAVRAGVAALRNSLFDILKNREDEISPRMSELIVGLYEDWLWLDERIETITKQIEEISQREGNCLRLMSVPGVGPLISTAVGAAIGTGEAFDRGRDFGAWLGLVPRQYSTGGRSILGSISKRGSRYLRTLFIQAAKVLLMRPQNWPKFSFGAWPRPTCRSNRPDTYQRLRLSTHELSCDQQPVHTFGPKADISSDSGEPTAPHVVPGKPVVE